MEFPRQEYWRGLPCPPPGHLPYPGIKPVSLASPALAGSFFSNSATWEAPFESMKVKSLIHARLFVTLWTVACQAPLSMGFSRQQFWSGLPFLFPGDLPYPGIEPGSPAL